MKFTDQGLKEYAIGEQLTVGTDTLVVVEDPQSSCTRSCYFKCMDLFCDYLECRAEFRSDCRNVHFKKVKEGI